MNVTDLKGFAAAKALYSDRTSRVTELKQQGRKIFGYLCLYPVIEMLTACEIVPFRLFGDIDEPITKADKFLPSVVCPFLRSYLDVGLKGRYKFLDGIVTAHICDVGSGIPAIWNYALEMPYTYHLDTPHTLRESARDQMRRLLEAFKLSLEGFTGRKISTAALSAAVAIHNRQRSLVKELYELKKPEPPLLSGVETLEVLRAVQSLPVEEGNQLLQEVLAETRSRPDRPARKSKRLMIWGSILDNTSLLQVIEGLDANVVMDDTCVGSRAYFGEVKATPDPLDGLADYYLTQIKCPRTFLADYYAQSKEHMRDLKMRYGYLGGYARDWKVDGIVLEALRYCDTHGYEIPSLKDYLKQIGLPSIYLEHDYTRGVLGQIKTRVQAFLEILG